MFGLDQAKSILAQSNIIVKYYLCCFTKTRTILIDFTHSRGYNCKSDSNKQIERQDVC